MSTTHIDDTLNPNASAAKERTAQDAYQDLKDQASEALDDVKKVGAAGRDVAAAGYEAAKAKGRETRDDAVRRARTLEDSLLSYVDREPLKALAIAAGVGAFVGMWMNRK